MSKIGRNQQRIIGLLKTGHRLFWKTGIRESERRGYISATAYENAVLTRPGGLWREEVSKDSVLGLLERGILVTVDGKELDRASLLDTGRYQELVLTKG